MKEKIALLEKMVADFTNKEVSKDNEKSGTVRNSC